jgi:proteasome accessory factor B
MREYVGDVASAIVIRLDARNREAPDPTRYEELVQALSQRRHVRIRYRSFAERKEIGTLLSPFRMLFRRRSWYVIGRSSLHRAIRTFNVGRIVALELLETQYRIPPRFDLDRYLGDAWNLIREPDRPLAVRIRFAPLVASNVEEVRWHRSQQTEREPSGALLFRARVEGMQEIVWWILGYGEQAEVLEPPELRTEVARRIEAMRSLYDGRPAPPA